MRAGPADDGGDPSAAYQRQVDDRRSRWITAIVTGASILALAYVSFRYEVHPAKYGGEACGGGQEIFLISLGAFVGAVVCLITTIVALVKRRGVGVVVPWVLATVVLAGTCVAAGAIGVSLYYATACD
jgi:hypothetical protein